MKIKDEYILQNIAGKWVVIDTNARSVNFNKLLTLNNTGKLLWDMLEEGAERDALVSALEKQYGIDRESAESDVDAFVLKLKELECLESEEI